MDPKIVLGRTYLKLGDLEKARSSCEAALPTQATEAQNCLSEVVQAQSEAKLRDFEGKVELGKREDALTAALAVPVAALTSEQKKRFDDTQDKLRDLTLAEAQAKLPGKKEEAAILASGIPLLSPSQAQRKKARDILAQAQPGFLEQLVDLLKGTWLSDLLAVLAVILGGLLILYLLRAFLRWKDRYNAKGRRYDPRRVAGGTKTRWTLVPLVDEKKLGATELVMDAIARLPIELKQDLWKPASLLLRPKPPETSQTDLLIDFTIPPSEGIKLAEFDVDKLRTTIKFQDVSLTDAVQQLQLTLGNYKVEGVAKFLSGVGKWLKAGSPTITGTAGVWKTKEDDDTVIVRLNCSGGPPPDSDVTASARDYLSVTASTPQEDGTDIRALCADRVVFKLLYMLANPNATQSDTDAQAALRQGVMLLERCSKQSHGEATNKERKALLEKAAYNFEFARNCLTDLPQLLWLEGTALALVGEEKYDSAIARFQELEVASSDKHQACINSLRTQAKFNRAVLLARKGKGDLTRAMCVYEELLQGQNLPASVRWLAGLGKLTVIADYEQNAWKHFDQRTAAGWLDKGDELLKQVRDAKANQQQKPSPRDKLTFDFIVLEANRALAKCSLRFAETFLAKSVLKDGRPIRRTSENDGWESRELSEDLGRMLSRAIRHLEGCGVDAELLADRAYIELLLGRYTQAEDYAYQATRWNPDSERAYYLAAEACYCHGGANEEERARQYASAYYTRLQESLTPPATPEPELAAFRALWRDLKMKNYLASPRAQSAAA
ncbi:MAG: hypothetical protein WA188_23065 [Terriglobales bacterium]